MLVRGKRAFIQEKGSLTVKGSYGVYVEGSWIKDMGPYEEMRQKYPNEEVLGNGKQLLMPGFIDSHTHGSGLSFIQRGESFDILEKVLLNCEGAIAISPETNSALNAVHHLKNGCTTLHHNDWVMPLQKGELQASCKKIKAYKETGIRLAFSCGTRNKNILAYGEEELLSDLPKHIADQVKELTDYDKAAATEQFFSVFDQLYETYNSDHTKILLGPNWVQGSTDDFLIRVKERADMLGKLPIHIHTLQTPIQKAYGIRTYGKSLVGHLDDLGLVDENLVLGHAVFLNEEDMRLLGEKGACVTHHPSCNLAMRNGIAPVMEMQKHHIHVAMGIDEKGINDDEDPIMEMRMMYYLQRINRMELSQNPFMKPETAIEICTKNGSRVCGFGEETGVLEPGKRADLILVDLENIEEAPWVSPDASFLALFVHRALGRFVNTVMIDGEVVMKERKLLTIDEEALYEQAREEAEAGRTQISSKYCEMMESIRPYYERRYDSWIRELALEPYYIVNSKI